MKEHNYNHIIDRLRLMRNIGFAPKCIFDIGAYRGAWTQKCLAIFPDSTYYCFEPLDECQQSLENLCRENLNVHYLKMCIGDNRQRAIINIDGPGSSILNGHWDNPYGAQKEIALDTIDHIVKRGTCSMPDLMKLDVQGFELRVIEGAKRILKDVQAVIVEVSFFPFQTGMPIFHEIVGEMSKNNFIVLDILGLKTRPIDGLAGQAHVLFVRNNHFLVQNNKWDHDSVY